VSSVKIRWRDAGAILNNHGGRPFLPRWVAYMNIWAGLLYFPAALPLFLQARSVRPQRHPRLYVPLARFRTLGRLLQSKMGATAGNP
jgi:hypothetical protein